jgi:hypothetical protein
MAPLSTAAFGKQLPPPSEQLVAVHIVTPRHDRHRRTGRLRFRHHLALQRFGILSTLRLLSVRYAASGHLFCLLRHPPIIAPIGVQRQALLTERLRLDRLTKLRTVEQKTLKGINVPVR